MKLVRHWLLPVRSSNQTRLIKNIHIRKEFREIGTLFLHGCWASIIWNKTQRHKDTEKKVFLCVPVTPSVVEGSHIILSHIILSVRYVNPLDYARGDKMIAILNYDTPSSLNILVWVFIGIHAWDIFITGLACFHSLYIYKLHWFHQLKHGLVHLHWS